MAIESRPTSAPHSVRHFVRDYIIYSTCSIIIYSIYYIGHSPIGSIIMRFNGSYWLKVLKFIGIVLVVLVFSIIGGIIGGIIDGYNHRKDS
jgi:ABC-type proline/glycine betaine transport system permease subunit